MTAPVERRAARVVLRDLDGAILLIHGGDPGRPDVGTWWFTPGGGIEPGETDVAAARRELAEETGLTRVELRRVAWTRDTEFEFEGTRYHQSEVFFTATVERFTPDASGWTELERRAQDELRWWTRSELDATRETVYPERFAELLAAVDAATSA